MVKGAKPGAAPAAPAAKAKKGGKAKGAGKVSGEDAAAALADIFSAVPAKPAKAQAAAPATAPAAASGPEPAADAAPAGDGLYRAKAPAEEAMEMADDAFFGVSREVAKGGPRKIKGRLEPGDEQLKLFTEAELLRMTGAGRNTKAGTTPNCPFDCDCCF